MEVETENDGNSDGRLLDFLSKGVSDYLFDVGETSGVKIAEERFSDRKRERRSDKKKKEKRDSSCSWTFLSIVSHFLSFYKLSSG